MKLYSENIDKFIGQTVKININHKIYGKQRATVCSFQPFYSEEKIGFVINDREFYMYSYEIENIEADKKTIYIKGTMQDVVISVSK